MSKTQQAISAVEFEEIEDAIRAERENLMNAYVLLDVAGKGLDEDASLSGAGGDYAVICDIVKKMVDSSIVNIDNLFTHFNRPKARKKAKAKKKK